MSNYLKQWREYTKNIHRGNKKCPHCGRDFSDWKDYYEHLKLCVPSKIFVEEKVSK